jgi:glucose/arabinose dehydrogenase
MHGPNARAGGQPRPRRRLPRLAALLAGVLILVGCGPSSPSSAAVASPSDPSSSDLVDIGAGLQGPAGLTATVYTTGLANASAFAVDPAGRLWVATAAYGDEGADGVYLLTAPGATPIEVVDGLVTPLGMLWYGGSLYVSSDDGVVAYSGLVGHSFASHRTILAVADDTGELNGLALGPDGRIAVGISAPCDACDPTDELSASVVSVLPDGSDLRVEASGIRAAVGLTYYPGTSDLFVTMNQRDDLGEATPGDWLSVIERGQDWGFPACYGQGGAACAGSPTPTAVLDRHAAVSGVAIVTTELGPTIGSSAIVAEWATGKVLRVALANDGGTYRSTVSPFLTGLQNPVPVIVSPDGAILVGDWGTGVVYRIASA